GPGRPAGRGRETPTLGRSRPRARAARAPGCARGPPPERAGRGRSCAPSAAAAPPQRTPRPPAPGRSAQRADTPGAGPRLAGLERDEILARAEGVGGAGHRLDRDRPPAPLTA